MTAPKLSDRTLDVLEAMAALGSASLPQIQAASGLPLTTTHRIVNALAGRGFAMKLGRGQYRLGPAVLALSSGLSERLLLEAAARAHLPALSRRTRSHSHLAVFEDGMVTYVVKHSFGPTQVHSAEGIQLEAYCSALGKVLLAGQSDEEVDRYLCEGELVALTPRTITDPERLRDQIRAIRARSWALDDEEIAAGLRCLAVPVRDAAGTTIAAVSISTVSAQAGPESDAHRIDALHETAAAIAALAAR